MPQADLYIICYVFVEWWISWSRHLQNYIVSLGVHAAPWFFWQMKLFWRVMEFLIQTPAKLYCTPRRPCRTLFFDTASIWSDGRSILAPFGVPRGLIWGSFWGHFGCFFGFGPFFTFWRVPWKTMWDPLDFWWFTRGPKRYLFDHFFSKRPPREAKRPPGP